MIPLYSTQQVREADSFAINILGIPSIVLMENAARSIYFYVLEYAKEYIKTKTVGIVCGKGNNGGDGFALARHFVINGFTVYIISLGSEEELKGDALINFRIIKNLLAEYPQSKLIVYQSLKDLTILDNCDIIIDAMLGTGSRGILNEPYKQIVQYINELNAYRIAVDLPTGLDLETATGETIFDADLTVTLSEFKTGLFYGKGYTNCGNIVKGSIGIGEEYYQKLTVDTYLIEPEDAFVGLPIKELNIHKYSAGKVFVIAGSSKMPGASFFTTNTIMKSGTGACFLAFPKSIKLLAQQKLDSAIVDSYDDEGKGYLSKDNLNELMDRLQWTDVIAIGPGLGREEETQEAVKEILNSYKTKKIVIDADAIYAIRNKEYQKFNLKGKILTPHHKEFADLLGIEVKDLENNLLSIGKQFAKDLGCYLVLKGAPTMIFNPKGETFINTTGNPGLAKFGSGDVLTGLIASFQAQSDNIEESLISAVYIHSLAADLLLDKKTEYGYIATDLMEEIPNAIKFLINSFV
ncbi:MAG: NAD(P)H-hydrate dehydratase [Melioribacter sp.]|nr:NAD(P)H-hydrate dehydratase [Melioribacter sp.]